MNTFRMDQYQNIMILVPHQDDEILMAAGVIYEGVKAGIRVKVVIATNGDYECADDSKGRMRLEESLRGTGMLGLDGEDLIFLGYADTGMWPEESFLLRLYGEKDPKKIYRSLRGQKTYGLEEKPEFHMERRGSHADYTRENLAQDLKDVLLENRPDCIITTCASDLHGDHRALFLFIRDALKEIEEKEGYRPALYCGLVHSCAGDEAWPDREAACFDCPEGFEKESGLLWEERYSFSLPEELSLAKGEKNLKRQALLAYETALEPDAVEFLTAFIKNEEVFWKIQ